MSKKRLFRSFVEPSAVPRKVTGAGWPASVVDITQYEPLEATVSRILRTGQRLSVDAPQSGGIYDEDEEVPIYRQRGVDASDVKRSVEESAATIAKVKAERNKSEAKRQKEAYDASVIEKYKASQVKGQDAPAQ